jgi:hypothetical protein
MGLEHKIVCRLVTAIDACLELVDTHDEPNPARSRIAPCKTGAFIFLSRKIQFSAFAMDKTYTAPYNDYNVSFFSVREIFTSIWKRANR